MCICIDFKTSGKVVKLGFEDMETTKFMYCVVRGNDSGDCRVLEGDLVLEREGEAVRKTSTERIAGVCYITAEDIEQRR